MADRPRPAAQAPAGDTDSERPGPPPLPERVTLPLLTLITQQSLDEDYRWAAERRRAARAQSGTDTDTDTSASVARPAGGRAGGLAAAAVVAVFGVMVTVAFVQTSRQEDVSDASRTTLISRIDGQRERVDAVQADLVALRTANAGLQDQATTLDDDEQAVEARLRRLQVRTGFVPVRGEGVRVVVEENPAAVEPEERVSDLDLTLLVNALWSAGAEAVSVNGQRVTALTAIRTSGDPIKVNSIGIAAPYTVLAIGDSAQLQADFYDTGSGLAFDGIARALGFTYELSGDDELSLPAGPGRFEQLRFARDPEAPPIDTRPDDQRGGRAP
ncbi:DUF881 domain-containing protein [Nocardioides nanhaiensis]|uniref:DUF881 domain-containing protein n=1 Tax=Nocardioides nanhaiensis TaxID=1476871 RepID=A0ABP8WN90_9ACTN